MHSLKWHLSLICHVVWAVDGGAGWQKRYFLLRDPGVLSYYEHEEDVSVVEDPKWEVDIKVRLLKVRFRTSQKIYGFG